MRTYSDFYVNAPGGQVFWVAPTDYVAANGIAASDSHPGTDPRRPLATIQAALNSCTSGRGDVVMLLPGSITITAALTMTNDDVTLRAAIPVGPKERGTATIVCATDCNMISTKANNIVIEGIVFDDNVTASTANTEIIQLNYTNTAVMNYGCVIRNCYFDMEGSTDTDKDCIRVGLDASDAAVATVIEGCVVWCCEQDAIVLTTGSANSQVRNCWIGDNGTMLTRYGIDVGALNCQVIDNVLTVGGTAGINISLAAAKALCHRNHIAVTGADTICILVANTATCANMDNYLISLGAGNYVDYTTSCTSPSGDINWANTVAADPGAADIDTPTVDGS